MSWTALYSWEKDIKSPPSNPLDKTPQSKRREVPDLQLSPMKLPATPVKVSCKKAPSMHLPQVARNLEVAFEGEI
jgi:hypothetical protein